MYNVHVSNVLMMKRRRRNHRRKNLRIGLILLMMINDGGSDRMNVVDNIQGIIVIIRSRIVRSKTRRMMDNTLQRIR